MNVRFTSAIALVALLTAACGGRTVVTEAPAPVPAEKMAELWKDPGPEARDVFWGIGGEKYAPPPDVVYKLKAKDDTGFSVSYDVVSPDGVEWSAKIGAEAQTEVVVSRLLWALGYHQPPIYYLPSWKLDVGDRSSGWRAKPGSGRSRNTGSLPSTEVGGQSVSGTRPFKGLLVVMLMLNSRDLKDDNNSIYQLNEPWDGASQWFVVRDVGAALGETGKLYPRRNWLEGFEKAAFITSIGDGKIEFDYKGRHEELLSMIQPADVQWAASQMQRLTDQQLRDAFRAANYAEPIAERYIRRIREKVADGLVPRVDARFASSSSREH